MPPGGTTRAQHVVDEDELIAGRIGVLQRSHLHARGQLGPQQGDDVVVLDLDADDRPPRADQLHGGGHALDDAVDALAEDLFILVQEGLAFGGVQHQGVGAGGQFHVGGKAGAAGPDHPRFGNVLDSDFGHG